ncbi:hypothetical protein [uncultured Polaribacter sp.]|uniref:hypothetical protein n=1 Tax=uncultured Polaribacter sp. TaxID=174711 RepID=UPI00262BA7D9|nr:hypothetical protein [uncultured Polaribacter sp.]
MAFLNKPTINKNVKYFLIEVLIVVLGILFALQLNNWNEGVHLKTEEEKALKLLVNELKMDRYIMSYSKQKLKNSSKYLTKISEGKIDDISLDSILINLENEYVHQKMNSAYLNLKYEGKLNIIDNDELKNELISFYEAYYSGHEALTISHTAFSYNILRPYILKELPIHLNKMIDESIVREKLKDPILMNLINFQITKYNLISGHIDLERVDTLIKIIQEELNN